MKMDCCKDGCACCAKDKAKPATLGPCGRASIHTAIATIITFSVSETNPSGTLLLPPTQAHFSSRLSI